MFSTPFPFTQHAPTYTPEQPTLSPAQLGREASYAIRMLISQRNLADAYTIVNSVRYAGLIETASSLPGVEDLGHFRSVAIAFTPDVSPRLPSHTLLHGLIRLHMLDEASDLAAQMIQAGISVRCRSLEALYNLLAMGAKQLPPTLSPISNNPGTRYALRILELARESRQRRSQAMFKTLIRLCLLNGEIIIASLIFGTLLRDWQSQQQSQQLASSIAPTAELTPNPDTLHHLANDICSTIDSHLLSNRTDPDSMLAFDASLQSLANLAHVLDQRLFVSHNVAALVCSMYRCPKGKERVWVPDKGNVVAYAYFHGVLARLICDLPRESSRPMLPFDLPTLTTLLNYALRHRQSVRLAEKVLQNMMHNLLEPNAATMNILEKAEPLLRNSRIKGLCLKLLDRQMDELKHATFADFATKDNYTLSIRISRLIATEKERPIIRALNNILPGLFPCRILTDLDLLRRAVDLGPVVFTSILHALEKMGRTGIAERVWRVARRAEELSWDMVHEGEVVKPWCLPIHAYTIMINVYAKEAKKGRAYFVAQGQSVDMPLEPKLVRITGWGRDPIRGWKKKIDEKSRHYLGRQLAIKVYRAMMAAPEEITRREKKLRERKQRSEGSLRVVVGRRQLEVPHADAPLFNAILDVVGRHPHMPPRRPGKKRYARRLRHSLARFAAGHYSPVQLDPALPQIAADMTRAGFAVPLLYQRLLIGTEWSDSGWRRYERDRRVWAVATSARPVYNADAIRVHPNTYY